MDTAMVMATDMVIMARKQSKRRKGKHRRQKKLWWKRILICHHITLYRNVRQQKRNCLAEVFAAYLAAISIAVRKTNMGCIQSVIISIQRISANLCHRITIDGENRHLLIRLIHYYQCDCICPGFIAVLHA